PARSPRRPPRGRRSRGRRSSRAFPASGGRSDAGAQRDGGDRPLSGLRRVFQAAAILGDYRFRYGHTQADTPDVVLRAEEGVLNALEHLGRHAAAPVGDHEPHGAGSLVVGCRDAYRLLGIREGLAGVLDEVYRHLLEALEMRAHGWPDLRQIEDEP